jgi:hypothetical protein
VYKNIVENHLLIIYYDKYRNTHINNDIRDLYKKIIKSFEKEETHEFIDIYFGNNQINTMELKHLLPIYI